MIARGRVAPPPAMADKTRLKPLSDRSTLERVRPATAGDVEAIHALIDEASRSTTVLPRSRDNIAERLRDFMVIDDAGAVAACGALMVTTRGLAEIKSLVVGPAARGGGLGSLIVRALVDEARRLGLRRVFALTDNPPYFERLGFDRADKATLPHKVWNECIHCPKFLNCQEEAVEIVLGTAPRPGAAGPDSIP
jgi:amino-acid N-acetyltransferase